MDPFSHGIFGMGLVQSIGSPTKKEFRIASIVGFVAALCADLDIVIRSSDFPLMAIKYHRHFTHSLFFTPFGGLFTALLLWPFFLRSPVGFLRLWWFCFLGYSTHGLLDACTSYGTHLLWPINVTRYAWNNISIVDPILTALFSFLVFFAVYKKSASWGRTGLFFALSYLFFGLYQRENALYFYRSEIQKNRNLSEVHRIEVKPSFGNIVLWRGIYEYQDHFYSDALWVFPKQKGVFYPGDKARKVDIEKDFSFVDKKSILYQDLKTFEHFSDYMLIYHPKNPNVLGDFRYALLPQEVSPMWGIEIDLNHPQKHVPFRYYREFKFLDAKSEEKLNQFGKMLLGR